MFKVTQQIGDASDILYSEESLPGAAARGVVFFDADKTLVFNGINPPPNWVNPADADEGLYYFHFYPEVDEYRKPVNYTKYWGNLSEKEQAAIQSEFADGCDMHIFKLKRGQATFFVAKFVKKGERLDLSQHIRVMLSDIIICEPLSLLLTCHILVLNGYYVEWGTQRLCLKFGEESAGLSGAIHPGIVRVRLAFDALFRDERLFLRTSFVASYSAAMLASLEQAKIVSGQANLKDHPNKYPLCESLVKQLVNYESSRGLAVLPRKFLVDDDKDYGPAFVGKESYTFVHAIPTKDDMCHPLRVAIAACGLTDAQIKPTLMRLRNFMQAEYLTELDIQHFRHYVLRDLSISVMRKSLRPDIFFRKTFVGGDVYGIAFNESKVFLVLRDNFVHTLDLCKGPACDLSNGEVKAFCVCAFPDEIHFLIGGRVRKDTKKSSGKLLVLNNLGTIIFTFDIDLGVIIGIQSLNIQGQFLGVCLGLNHVTKTLTLYTINCNKRDLTTQIDYPITNFEEQDSVNRHKYGLSTVDIQGTSFGMMYKVALVASANDMPCEIRGINGKGQLLGDEFKPKFPEGNNFSLATHAFCRFESHEKLWLVYGYKDKVDIWKVNHKKGAVDNKVGLISSLIIPNGYQLCCLDISDDSELLGLVFYDTKIKVTLVQLVKIVSLEAQVNIQETKLQGNLSPVTACRFIKLNDIWHLICPIKNLLQIVNYRQ